MRALGGDLLERYNSHNRVEWSKCILGAVFYPTGCSSSYMKHYILAIYGYTSYELKTLLAPRAAVVSQGRHKFKSHSGLTFFWLDLIFETAKAAYKISNDFSCLMSADFC